MRDQQLIDEGQYQTALAEKVHLVPVKKSDSFAYFLAMIRDGLSERYDLPVLLSGRVEDFLQRWTRCCSTKRSKAT